jgi:hypothetical protein
MNKFEKLRKDCIRLMAEKGLTKRGGQTMLAKKLNRNNKSLSMALSGYRSGPGSEQLLRELKEQLRKI